MSWKTRTSGCARKWFRLPTVAEWERAATPARGEYPWREEEPDPERANFGDVRKPTPVGIYLSGAAAPANL